MDTGSVGAPMPGVVVDVKVKVGDVVTEGEQIITMSAMKMETAIPAPRSGVVKRVTVNAGDKVRMGVGVGGDCMGRATARVAPQSLTLEATRSR